MRFGICNLSIVPIRSESSDKSEQISQIIYGEVFSILEEKTKWSKISLVLTITLDGLITNNLLRLVKNNSNL